MKLAAERSPVRLSYRLSLTGRAQQAHLTAKDGTVRLDEPTLRRMMPHLHPLDAAIARELSGGTVYGQLGDGQLARLLPLLAQRATELNGSTLRIDTRNVLVPRLRVEAAPAKGLRLTLGLCDSAGHWRDIREGRLFAGPQAFFMYGQTIVEVRARAPWELAPWARHPVLELAADLTPSRRDDLVRELGKIGVPDTDLARLAILRQPPERIVAHLRSSEGRGGLEAHLLLAAEYAGEQVAIAGRAPTSPYVVPESEGLGLIERDLAIEEYVRTQAQVCGLRYDTALGCFVARGERALTMLDPTARALPRDWQIVRVGEFPAFRRDLNLSARVRMVEERGLLEVAVDIGDPDEQAKVEALIGMKELLAWIEGGSRYVQLADGSFVAPSKRFKKSVAALSDMGALAERALVSPLCVGLLRLLGESAAVEAADAATRQWLREVSGEEKPPPVAPPEELAGVLRHYQEHGLDWLAMLHRHRLTGILADDMGLGKTVQTLALLLKMRADEGPKPSLIVAPTSVLSVWRDEAARFVPSLRVLLWHGSPEARKRLSPNEADLVVTSYGILRRDAELLSKVGFRYVVLDEAQSAKNAGTQNARAVRLLKSERRLALTGTPIENRAEELWATFDFLAPGFLGSLRSFRKRYGRPIDRGDETAAALLSARVHPFVLRRLKEEVARELPPKIESVVRCDMLPAQRALYEHLAGELKESVQRKIQRVGIERAQMDILAALTRLRQVCCDPHLLPGPAGVKRPESAKLALFEELMREALASERRVVVFSQFVEMQKRLIAVIEALGVKPLWLHGGTRRRDQVVARFQDPEGPPVIVVSLKAGGTGLTLTRADTVMHYDPWWNPAVERQATDRAHRIGQDQQVTVYKLVCSRSIEERVIEMAARKDELASRLLGSEGEGPKRISPEDVLGLIG